MKKNVAIVKRLVFLATILTLSFNLSFSKSNIFAKIKDEQNLKIGFNTGYNYTVEKEILNHSNTSSAIKEKTIKCTYTVESDEGIIVILEQKSTYEINHSQSILLSSDKMKTIFIKKDYSLEEIDKNTIAKETKVVNFKKFIVRKNNIIIHRFGIFHRYDLSDNLLAGTTENG